MGNIQRSVCRAPATTPGVEVAREGFRCELRLVREELPAGVMLPEDVAAPWSLVEFLFDLVREEPVEVFGAVYYDATRRAVGFTMPYRGTVDKVGPEIRHLLIKAWCCRAAGMVVFHNHPGGNPVASAPDIQWTRHLVALAAPLRVEVRDHIVLGAEPRYYSIAGAGQVRGLGERPETVWSWKRTEEQIHQAGRGEPRRRRAKPKFRDPETGETWAGRGSMAKWLRRRLAEGRDLEEFRIREDEDNHDAPKVALD